MVEKEKCKDSIQKLMKIIITQGNPEIIPIPSAYLCSVLQEIQFRPS